MLEKIQELVAEGLNIEVEKVVPTASFKEDLGADSLDIVELIMNIEEEFGLEISDQEAENIKTVQDVVKYIATSV